MPPDQVSDAEVSEAWRRRDYAQINIWRKAGQLDELLAGRDPGHLEPEVDELEVEEQPDSIPVGDADQGARGGINMGQLTDDDVRRLYSQRRYADINQARREGRLDVLLGRR